MAIFFGALIAVCLTYCALVIAPVALLLRARLPKAASGASITITTCLYYDHVRNWDGLSYPYWLLRGFDDFYPVTMGASILMLLLALKSIWDKAIEKL